MTRASTIERETKETSITIKLFLDGKGESNIYTGVGFFDHMLTQVSRHGFFDIFLNVKGDLDVDSHHVVEDVGIALGIALRDALGKKEGIKRYGQAVIPMDESLAQCAIDISGRPYLYFQAGFTCEKIGAMQTEMIEEFFRAICVHAGITLHIDILHGKNNHHMAEAIFKAFGKALSEAIAVDQRIEGVLSTKGTLE